jgi:hypothetical protein
MPRRSASGAAISPVALREASCPSSLHSVEPEHFDLDDAVIWGLARTWSARVTAFGSHQGSPFLVSIDEGGQPCTATFPDTGRVTSAAGWERTLVSVEVDGAPRFYEVSTPLDVPLQIELIEDEFTRAPARLWVRCGDEDPGCLLMDHEGWVRAGDPYGEDWSTSPRTLRAASPTTTLHVNMSETTVYVGGLLTDTDGEPRPSIWELTEDGARELAADTSFDGISDISDGWEPCFAGHRDGRPLVVTAEGDVLSSPSVELDPGSPTVLVATKRFGAESDDQTRLVVQAVDGVQLWTKTTKGWQAQDLPGDVLHAARYDSESSTLWFVTDNRLWHLLT